MKNTFDKFAVYFNPYTLEQFVGEIVGRDDNYFLLKEVCEEKEEWVLKSYCKPWRADPRKPNPAPKQTNSLLSKLAKCSCGALYAETDRYGYRCGNCQ